MSTTTTNDTEKSQEESEKLLPKIIPATQEQVLKQVQIEIYLSLVVFIIMVGSIAFWKRYILFGIMPKNLVKISQLLSLPEKYIGKKLTVEGKITFLQPLSEQKMLLYRIRDVTGEIYGVIRKAGYEGEGTVRGVLRKGKTGLYIEF